MIVSLASLIRRPSLTSHDWTLISFKKRSIKYPVQSTQLGITARLSHTPTTMPPIHLIIVCGHAIWLGGPQDGWDESEWLIEGYKKGETPTFIEHIKAGVKLLSQDEDAVLVFSG